jgi:hypothetical protein
LKQYRLKELSTYAHKMAALLPPGGIAPLVPLAQQTATFAEFYTDVTRDEHHRQYAGLMALFESPGGVQTPAQLRELVCNNPRESSLGFAILCLHAQGGPGLIYAVHTLARFAPRLGQPATQWDGQVFGSINEVTGNQIPTTVVLPADALARQGGGAMFRVGVSQRMDATFNTNPNYAIVGEFTNFDAGTELIQSRNMVPVPHRYMRHFVRGPLTPRQAWEIVGHDITVNNDIVNCAPLYNFLRLACTINAAGDTASPLAQNQLVVPLADAVLIAHRTELIQHKLPSLNRTPILAAGQQVAASLGELVQEQRAARAEQTARQLANSITTLDDHFGASLQVLMRICQVATPQELPPVYQACADNGRRRERVTMQRHIDEMMHQMGLSDLQFVITAELATKVTSLSWKAHPEDLAQGIHPFTVGEVNPEALATLQGLARTYDLITSEGAAPNLADAQELVGAGRVSIARNLIALDSANHLFLAFLNVFLGPAHQCTVAWNVLTQETMRRLITLQFYQPRTPRHQLLLPALLQRFAQLRWSYWVSEQWNSLNNVPAPDYNDIWRCITLKTDWESPLPERYLAQLTPFPTLHQPAPSIPPPPPAPGAAHSPPVATGTTRDQRAGEAVRCLPYNEKFTPHRQTGERVRDVVKRAAMAGQTIPQNDAGVPMCISYHVKGICNTRCGRSADHISHSEAETSRLLTWCVSAFTPADP